MNIQIFILSFFLMSTALASPNELTYQGTLTDNADNPITTSTTVVFRILNPAKTCILYSETQNVSPDSEGNFLAHIGSAVGAAKRTSEDANSSMVTVLQNSTQINGKLLSDGSTACSYTPSSSDLRYLQVEVAGTVLSPDVAISSVPSAKVAESIEGLTKSSILQVNNSGSTSLTQANLEAAFTGTAYTNLQEILGGNFLKTDTSGAALPSFTANPGTAAEGDMWYDSVANVIKFHDGTGVKTLSTGSSSVQSVSATGPLSSTGGTTPSLSISQANSTTSGYLSSADWNTFNNKLGTATAFSGEVSGTVSAMVLETVTTPGKVSGNAITSGTISGSTAINTSGNLVTTGVVSGLTGQFTNLRVYNGTKYVELNSPNLSSNVTFSLPSSDGTAGYVLKTDGLGQLYWGASASGSVTSVTGAGPISSTGGATPSISISQANSTTGGYLSSTDWNAFNNKIGASTAFTGDVSGNVSGLSVERLRGVNFSPAAYVSGQALQYNGTAWVNRIIDFASLGNTPTTLSGYGISDAISNGLQSGYIIVGSAGNLASKVQMSGDATISNTGVITLQSSGVGAGGTYTKVTVDSKGRVTSASQIVTADVTSALNYVPLNKAGDVMTGTLGLYAVSADPSTAGWAASESGRAWYNTTDNAIKYWNGSAVATLGTAGSGLQSLNGQTDNNQTFTVSGDYASATSPSIDSSSGVHNFRFPLANRAGVTAGLISKGDYDFFSNKLNASATFSGDVTGTYGAMSTEKLRGRDITAASVSGQMMIYDGTRWVNSVMTGDGSIDYNGLFSLATSGVASGTYTKVQVNNKGIVTSASQLVTSDITNALGFTPATSSLVSGQIFVGDTCQSRACNTQ